MIIYIFPIFITIMAVISSLSRDRVLKYYHTILIALGFILIAGLRSYSDIDFVGYMDIYNEVPTVVMFNFNSIGEIYGEPGYLFLNSILKTAGIGFYLASFLFVLISIFIKTRVSLKFSAMPSLSLCLFFCIHFITIEFIQIRWAIATSLLILGFYFQYKRNLIQASLIYLIAGSIHYFSFIFIIVSLLMELRSEKIFYTLLIMLGLMGSIFQSDVLMGYLTQTQDLYIVRKTVLYLGEGVSQLGIFSYLKLILYLSIFVSIRTLAPHFNQFKAGKDIFVYKLSLATISLTLFCSFIPIFHHRAVVIADYFSIISIINLFEVNSGKKIIQVSKYVIIMLFLIWYSFDLYNAISSGSIIEYNSWLL